MSIAIAYDALLRSAGTEDLLALGLACSTGANGQAIDLVSAHKWFNLAALAGSQEAQYCRSDVADQMSRAEIAQAQRGARIWLASQSTH